MTASRPARALLAAGAAVLLLFALGTFLPRDPDFDLLFGVEGYRLLGVPVFLVAAAALLAVLLVPGPARAIGNACARFGSLVPARFRPAALPAAAGGAFLLLTNYNLSGDAGSILHRLALGEVYPSNALTNYVFQGLARLGGLDPREAIRLTSCLAGVLFAFAARGIGRDAFDAGPRRAGATGLLLTSGTVGLFFGTIEVYPLLVAGSTLYLWLGLRWLDGKSAGAWPPLCLGVVFCLHMSAGLLLPSLLLLANRGRLRPVDLRRWIRWGLLFLLPVALTFLALFVFEWHGALPAPGPELYGTLLGVKDEGPVLPLLLSPIRPLQRYAILDLEHLVGVLNLLALVAPAGLLLLVLGRRPWPSPRFRFVAVAALFLALFPNFWNISYEIRRDWDLFSGMGIPLTLLGALAFLPAVEHRAGTVRVVAISVFCCLPFVLSNHLDASGRLHYAEVMVRQAGEPVSVSASRDAARLAIARASEGGRPPAPREGRRREEELARAGNAALLGTKAFTDVRPAVDPDRFRYDLERALRDTRWPIALPSTTEQWAHQLTTRAQWLCRAIARGEQPWNGAGMFSLEVVDSVLDAGLQEGWLPSPTVAFRLEPWLLDATDAAILAQGTFEPGDPVITPAPWETIVARELPPSATGDPARWRRMLVDALVVILGRRYALDHRLEWPTLLDMRREWRARIARTAPPGFDLAFSRAEQVADLDLARGETLARHLLAGAPAEPSYLALLGAILAAKGEREEARRVLGEAIRADPTNLHPRYHLSGVLLASGDRDAAARCLERGLHLAGGILDVQVPRMLMRLAHIRMEEGDRPLARRLFELALHRLQVTPGTIPARAETIEEAKSALRALGD